MSRFILLAPVLVLVLPFSGCASLGGQGDKNSLTLTDTSVDEFKPVPVDQIVGMAAYDFTGKKESVEWIACRGKKPAGTLFVMHRDRAGYDRADFCQGWIAQSFVSQGFDVISVNRPGYGASTGTPDFSGAQSMAALDSGLKGALATAQPPKPLVGIWGYSTGATAAALFAKHAPRFQFMILGGGVYDFEETLKHTQDGYIKADIETIQKTGGSKALEDRSIGYDVAGLPKKIAIYHGKLDTAAPLQQAKAFADSLAGSQYDANFQAIEGVDHEIPWMHHRKILEILAHAFAPGGTGE